MKIALKYEKKNNFYFAFVTGLAILLYIWHAYDIRVFFLFAALYYLIRSLKIDLSERLPWLWTGILFIMGAILSVWLMQHIILDNTLYKETKPKVLFLNILIALAIFFFFHFFIRNPRIAAISAFVFLICLAFLNQYVYAFRQNEFTFSDLTSAGTGLSVAMNYHFYMFKRGEYAIFISILFIALARKLTIRFKRKWRPLVDLAMVILLLLIVGLRSERTETQTWEQKGSKKNGYLLNYYLSVRDSFIRPPKDYSKKKIEALEKQYGGTGAPAALGSNEKRPTILFIMDESFADLSVLGDLKTNAEVMPFYHSLTENTLKGYALSSVFGAKTPNSEWEFMTGNSMAFLPAGSVVYQQYLGKKPSSLVAELKNDGYTTVAMHPYFSTGWRRNSVYPKLGFEEQYFMDDGYFDTTRLVRNYISDEELFDKVIRRFEEKGTNEKLFLAAITMQNHGGYRDYYPGFTNSIRQSNSRISPDADQYLSLAKKTDDALQKLIGYFEEVEEPVEIVFFGDHQPSLDDYFYYRLNGKGMANLTMDELSNFYKVPFFIWTNYETKAEKIDLTSLNFLSTLTLERAGFDELPPWHTFLKEMMKKIPAINSRGFFSKESGHFMHFEDASPEERVWLNDYRSLQYNNLFDRKHRSSSFFPYLSAKVKDGILASFTH